MRKILGIMAGLVAVIGVAVCLIDLRFPANGVMAYVEPSARPLLGFIGGIVIGLLAAVFTVGKEK